MRENNVEALENPVIPATTAIYLAVDNKLAGIFYVSDAIRKGAKEMITELKNSGVKNIILLTGDNPETARHVAKEVGITDYRANLLPEDKIKVIKNLQKSPPAASVILQYFGNSFLN